MFNMEFGVKICFQYILQEVGGFTWWRC